MAGDFDFLLRTHGCVRLTDGTYFMGRPKFSRQSQGKGEGDEGGVSRWDLPRGDLRKGLSVWCGFTFLCGHENWFCVFPYRRCLGI